MTCWNCGVRRQQKLPENSSSCFPSVCEQSNSLSDNIVPCNLVQKQCTVLVSWHQHTMITVWLSSISCFPSYHFTVWPPISLHQSALPLTFLFNASSHLSSIASLIVLMWALCGWQDIALTTNWLHLCLCFFIHVAADVRLSVGLKEFIGSHFHPTALN